MARPLNVFASFEEFDEEGNYTELKISVETDSGKIWFVSVYNGSVNEALAKFRKGIQIKGPYVLLSVDGGGGNAWRADGTMLFKLGKQKKYLGYLEQDALLPDGKFSNIYDVLEYDNGLTSHACAPGENMHVTLFEKNDELKMDAKATWRDNEAEYRAGLSVKRPMWKSDPDDPDAWLGEEQAFDCPSGVLLGAAALCKLVGKEQELARVLNNAKVVLDEKRYATLIKVLKKVKPFDPNTTREF
jgi:hypothetical protein